MSGEPRIVLAGAAMAPLVQAAAKVADAGLGRYAIVGGVAVSARLGQVHRATADIDTVVDDETPPPAVETLLGLPQAAADPSGPHRVLINGVKVEVQGTYPIESDDFDGLTDKQILYVGSHRYALESATAVTLVAENGEAHATVPIATPGAIVAMKLHAIEDRRPSGGMDKRAGDAWDMYRILLDLDRGGSVRRELATLQPPLRKAVAEAGTRILIDRAARTVSWLKAGDERMARVAVEDLRALAEPVIAAIDAGRDESPGR